MSYHYWDPDFRTAEGLTLQQCLDKYGTGTQNMGRNIHYQVIFLDAKRDYGNSWMLRCFNRATGENVPVRLYEDKKCFGPTPVRSKLVE